MSREYPSQPIVGVGAVVLRLTDAWEVLLVRRANPPSQHEWSIPGGGVELGERLEDAVAREALEETGLEVEVGGVVEVLDFITREDGRVRFHYVLVDYVCRVKGGTLAHGSDASAVSWQPVTGLSVSGDMPLRARTLTVIQKAVGVASGAK